MSFYKMLLTAVAAIALSSPTFADDTANTTSGTSEQVAATEQAGAESAPTVEQMVNLNTATVKELETVKGINARKAKAIVSYRKKHGNFKSVEDLKMVRGFKRMHADHLKAIEEQLMVE